MGSFAMGCPRYCKWTRIWCAAETFGQLSWVAYDVRAYIGLSVDDLLVHGQFQSNLIFVRLTLEDTRVRVRVVSYTLEDRLRRLFRGSDDASEQSLTCTYLALGMDNVQAHLPVDCQQGLLTGDLFSAQRQLVVRMVQLNMGHTLGILPCIERHTPSSPRR